MAGQLNGAAHFMPPGSCGDLHERTARIGQLYRRGAYAMLAGEVRALKLAARAWHFAAVERLAHVLEADLAATGSAAVVGAYIDRMDDAIACGDAGPDAMEAMLASIRARMVA